METDFKISIIMPIYNQEKYLPYSLKSITNQTIFNETELILVDDCSTDKSIEIVKKYAAKFPNIKPIFLSKNTGGAGIPRNIGIKEAQAPYLMFIDPDDLALDDYCEVLYNVITSKNADIVTANNIRIINKKPYYDKTFVNRFDDFAVPEERFKWINNDCCWASIYNRNFIINNNIEFLDAKVAEDTYFTIKAYLNAKKVIYLENYVGYLYILRDNESLTKSKDKETILSIIYAYDKITKMLKNEDIEIKYNPFLKNILFNVADKWDCTKEEKKEVFEEIRNFKKKNNYPSNLPIYYKIPNIFLEKNNFTLFNYYHALFSKLIQSKIVQNIFNSYFKKELNPANEFIPVLNKIDKKFLE